MWCDYYFALLILFTLNNFLLFFCDEGKETGGDEHETSGDSADDELHPKCKKETKNVQKPLNHNESSSSEHDTEDELKR